MTWWMWVSLGGVISVALVALVVIWAAGISVRPVNRKWSRQ